VTGLKHANSAAVRQIAPGLGGGLIINIPIQSRIAHGNAEDSVTFAITTRRSQRPEQDWVLFGTYLAEDSAAFLEKRQKCG